MRSSVELMLASASSRRCELLSRLGIIYTSYASDIDESPDLGENPQEYVQRMAKLKAKVGSVTTTEDLPILAADTAISIDEKIIGKPKGWQDVKNTLELLSGRQHQVLTALCLLTKTGTFESISKTTVKFRNILSSEIDAYSLTEEPYDKAGAYAMQGLAANFVEYFLGSYTNVVGLPLLEVQRILKQAGIVI